MTRARSSIKESDAGSARVRRFGFALGQDLVGRLIMAVTDMAADHGEGCRQNGHVIGKANEREDIRHHIGGHDEIGERGKENAANARGRGRFVAQ